MPRSTPTPGYPIELDLRGRRALVVGWGAVGRRKGAGLLAAGARLRIVDPALEPGTEPDAEAAGDAEAVEVRREPYRVEHLDGVCLAVAAASAEVNRRVVADARRLKIWVGSATEPQAGDFTVPAVWREGPLLLTVSTSGASPALAAALRDQAARALGPAAAGLAALLAELRPEVLARLAPFPDARRQVLADWADPRWITLWQAEGPEAVRLALTERLERARRDAESASSQDRSGGDPTR